VIAVAGTGRVSGEPDVVRLRVTASALRPTAAEAVAAAEATAAAVRAALAAAGIPHAPSGAFGLYPEQVWTEQGGPRITGHRCDHELRVVVRDLPALGRVIGDVLAAGGNGVRVDGVEPAIEDAAPLRARARELAWADALDRATRLAALAGRELGPVEEVVEGGPSSGPVPLGKAEAVSLAARDVSVQPGELDVTVVLHVRWALR
jgi:uncharacterized protein YggE